MRMLLKDIWPRLRYIWILDRKFWVPSKAQLKNLLKISKVDKEKYIPLARDCEDFSLQLNADIKSRALDIYRDDLAIAFGEVAGSEFRGRLYMHAVNICFCEEGVYLVEPQDDRIWEATSENDNVFFVKI